MVSSRWQPRPHEFWLEPWVAALAFAIYLVVAIPVLLSLGSHYWFKGDEWAFLVGGDISDPAILFRSIHGHWSTLPILIYRGLYAVFGLHSYLPFQLSLIVLHLSLCCLLRAIMRRSGVGPWMATFVAATFVLFGAGEANILAGVQVSQVGSMVFGFIHLILADHDGRISRRDWLGLLFGLMCIMSSKLGPLLVAMVGLAAICRRGWRPALFHTVLLAAAYVAWWVWLSSSAGSMVPLSAPSLKPLGQWVYHGAGGVFLALGGYPAIAVALSALLITGLVLVSTGLTRSEFRQRASLPVAMLVGALAVLVVLYIGRWWSGLAAVRADRVVGICTALSLPTIALALDAVVRRWRWMTPVVCLFLLVGMAVNTTRFGDDLIFRSPKQFAYVREVVLAAAYSPHADTAPADLRPDPRGVWGGDVDMAFLRAARDSGRLPPPPPMTDALKSQTELRLSVKQSAGSIPEPRVCATYTQSLVHYPEVGDLYEFKSTVLVALGESGTPIAYRSRMRHLPIIQILRPGLQLRFTPKPPADSFSLCHRPDMTK